MCRTGALLLPYIALHRDCTNLQPSQRTIWQYLAKLKIYEFFGSAISLPGMYLPDNKKWYMYKVICCSTIYNNKGQETVSVSISRKLINNDGTSIHTMEHCIFFSKRAMCNYLQDTLNENSQVQIMYILSYFLCKN